MAGRMAAAKLDWACPADAIDGIDEVNLTPAPRAVLAGIPEKTFRETARDFCVNRQFRKV
jgi:hypothetical protein